jgi:hypothetical protein
MAEKTQRIFSIRQEITAGSDWTGAVPTTARTWGNDIFSYLTDTVGGLFTPHLLAEFKQSRSMRLVGFEFMGGLQTSWSLSLVDVDGKVQTLYSGLAETSFLATEDSAVVIQSGENLKLVSAGAANAMLAKLKFGPGEV